MVKKYLLILCCGFLSVPCVAKKAPQKKPTERISLDSSPTLADNTLEVAAQNIEEKKIMLQNQLNSLNYNLEKAQISYQNKKQEFSKKTKILSGIISRFYLFCQEAFFSLWMRKIPSSSLLHVRMFFERTIKEWGDSLRFLKKSLQNSLQLEKTLLEEQKKCTFLLSQAQKEGENISKKRLQQLAELSKKYKSLAGGDNAYGMILEMPAMGQILASPKEGKVKEKKICIETAFGAKVASPTYGAVSHVGNLRGSRTVIIDHGGGYHSVLSNLENFFVSVGKTLYPGEEVGQMAGYGKRRPVLVFEFRGPDGALDPFLGLHRAGLR